MAERHGTGVLFGTTGGFLLVSLVSCTWSEPARYSDYIGLMSAAEVAEATERLSTIAAAGRGGAPERDAGPLKLSLQEAVLLALENNHALAVRRIAPAISETYEQQERAVFDPLVAGSASMLKGRSKSASGMRSRDTAYSAGVSAGALLPTGTTLAVQADAAVLDSSLYSDDFASTRIGMSVTQALLRGASLRANLASLHQARLDTLSSGYELRGFVEALLAEVESTYWDYALAEREIEIVTDSLKLAQKQLEETSERIKVGAIAEPELAAAQAEVSLRREDLINARSTLAKVRLRLLRLLNPAGKNLWAREVLLQNQPAVPEVKLAGVEEHVKVSLRMRPDLNQARLSIKRGDLEVVKTKNGLLPKMDLFVALGRTGYAESFGGSVGNVGSGYDLLVGLAVEYPPVNRDARARHSRAVLTRQQSREALANLAQLVQVDVRSAYIEVRRAREQIAATTATRKFQTEKLRAETGKFRVGRSTSLLVATAQRDLLAARIAEIRAVVNYLKALVELHRLEGSLLERRGVASPGREPVVVEGRR